MKDIKQNITETKINPTNTFVGVDALVSKPFVGMRVKTKDGDVGTIKSINTLHNIEVNYDNGGSGLHCLVKGCTEKIEGNIEVCYYDPLYKL